MALAIQKAARGSYRLPKTINDSVNQVLSISITTMRALEAQIKEFDKAIAALAKYAGLAWSQYQSGL